MMDNLNNLFSSGALLGIGTIIGIVLKFILDKSRQNHTQSIESERLEDIWVQTEFDRLTKRIISLEASYAKCIQNEAERERVIGHLTGELEGVKSLLMQMQKSTIKSVASEAADRTTENIHKVVNEVIDSKISQ